MADLYLHEHPEFPDLLRIIEEETGILAGLVEKDYWIMHCLYGLKAQGYDFQLKGGTSLSKGFGLIDRFSEDIDMHINPPASLGINEKPSNSSPTNIEKKKAYYDTLAREIKIDGIKSVERDINFDDTKRYNSGGIRLHYEAFEGAIEGIKQGILVEAGYDTTAPNSPLNISSWAFEKASTIPNLVIKDNRAIGIYCYDHRYTFVEKLQTIATKFRNEINTGAVASNYMRQYYDVFCLLADKGVQNFIGSEPYLKHKKMRFSTEDFHLPINKNEAFQLNDVTLRKRFEERYNSTAALYYKGQPPFRDILARIGQFAHKL